MGRYKNTDKAKTSKQTERSVPSFRFAKRGNARTQDEVCFEETKSARKLCLFLILFRFDVSTVTLVLDHKIGPLGFRKRSSAGLSLVNRS